MKLVHCADVHLDSPLESVFPPDAARDYRRAVRSNFASLVAFADENGADALLIAGDLFDSGNTSEKTVRYVLELFRAHPDLSVFYLAGNHDGGGLSGRDDLPPNLHTFGQDWTYYRLGNLTLAGGTAPDPDALELPRDSINIVLLHGQVTGSSAGEYGISFRRLKDKNIDYLALGHIHEYREAQLDDRGVACYPGCLMGRGFDECGKKGYILLETVNSRLTHRFVPYAPRTFHAVSLDVSDCPSALALERAAQEKTADIPQTDFCRLALVGAVPPDGIPDTAGLEAALSGRFALLRIRNETTLAIRPEDYTHDISLKGEFIRQVLASDLEESEKERVIACGLRVLRGEEAEE